MAADLWYLDTIRASARSPQTADPKDLRAALVAFGNACREANRRLAGVAGMLSSGLPGKAIAYAQRAPSLRELVAELDAVHGESGPLFTNSGLQLPPKLQLQVLEQLQRASADRQPAKKHPPMPQAAANRTRLPATGTSRQQLENPPGPPPLPPLEPAGTTQSKGPPALPVAERQGPIWLLPAVAILLLLLVITSFGGVVLFRTNLLQEVGAIFDQLESTPNPEQDPSAPKGQESAENAPGPSTPVETPATPPAEEKPAEGTPAEGTPATPPATPPAEGTPPEEKPAEEKPEEEPANQVPKDVVVEDFEDEIRNIQLADWEVTLSMPSNGEAEPLITVQQEGNESHLVNKQKKMLIKLIPTNPGFKLELGEFLSVPANKNGKWGRWLRHSVLVMRPKENPQDNSQEWSIKFREPDVAPALKFVEKRGFTFTTEFPGENAEVEIAFSEGPTAGVYKIHPDPEPIDVEVTRHPNFSIRLTFTSNYNRQTKTITVTGLPSVSFEGGKLELDDIENWMVGLDQFEKFCEDCEQIGREFPPNQSEREKLDSSMKAMKSKWVNAYKQVFPDWQQQDYKIQIIDLDNRTTGPVITPEGKGRQGRFEREFKRLKRILTQARKNLMQRGEMSVPTLDITRDELKNLLSSLNFEYEFFIPLENSAHPDMNVKTLTLVTTN